MAIVDKQADKYGRMWGFDDDAEEWVELDDATERGNVAGNLLRGAGRGFESLGLGLSELGGHDVGPEIEDLDRRSAAAGRRAPIAEAVGGTVPDVLAALGVGAATGGAGLIPMLAGEAGIGALSGALRPGSAEERMQRALFGAGIGAASLGVGQVGKAAISGIARGLAVAEGIAGRATGRVAGAIESGAGRIRQARGLEAEASTGEAASLSAARTPAGELGDDFAEEAAALRATEGAGAEVKNRYSDAMRSRAEADGYQSPLHADTRTGSAARLQTAARELNPLREIQEQAAKASNQKLVSHRVTEALGLDPRDKIELADLADAEAAIGNMFEVVKSRMPDVAAKPYGEAMASISPVRGLAGRSDAQKFLDDMADKAAGRGVGNVSGAEVIADRQLMSSRMADFYNAGKTNEGDAMRQAIEKLDGLIDKQLRRRGDEKLSALWEDARGKWQLLGMVNRRGVVNAQGDINPLSLRNAMKTKKSSGGFGNDGPRNPATRKVWDLANVMASDETGVPMTGARALMSRYGRPAIRGALAAVPGGAAATAAYNTIWGN